MALNKDAFIEKYLEELNENIRKVDTGTINLKKDPDDEEELNIILRALHTIKGSSRMLNFKIIEQIAHKLENLFKGIKEKRYTISTPIIQLIFITSDYLSKGSEKIKNKKNDEIPIKKISEVLDKAYSNEPFNTDDLIKEKEKLLKKTKKEININIIPKQDKKKRKIKEANTDEYDSIKVKLNTVDKIVKSVNNLIIKQFQLKKDYDLLHNLENVFNDLRMECIIDTDISNKNLQKKQEILLKEIQKIKKTFYEQFTILETNTFDIHSQILDLRMLPLEIVLGSFPKMVEELAINTGKKIDLKIQGMEVKLDKIVLEKINDPLLHIIRNCIDHGIESPKNRERFGKEETGQIEIGCTYESGAIQISIKDDGRGIDYTKVRSKALKVNPDHEEEINNMTEEELNYFLFSPGFTTSNNISEISGRGVGLDIVKYNIENIKGKISVKSKQFKGTEFILTLPLSLSTIEGFFITTSGHKFFIPSNFVTEVIILNEKEKIKMIDKNGIKLRNKIIPLYRLNDALNIQLKQDDTENFVVIVETMGDTIGIITETIIEYSSLIYKPLPKNLRKLSIVQGIVFDESFNIITILHIPPLIDKLKSLKNIDLKKRFIKKKKENQTILIVDDSLNTREIEKSILELENYKVITAEDGIEGVKKLKEKKVDLIITDINMPKMDGFTFIENIKRENEYNMIPIIVVTSYNQKEYKDKSKQLGANSYIVKSNFDRNNLLNIVKELIG